MITVRGPALEEEINIICQIKHQWAELAKRQTSMAKRTLLKVRKNNKNSHSFSFFFSFIPDNAVMTSEGQHTSQLQCYR